MGLKYYWVDLGCLSIEAENEEQARVLAIDNIEKEGVEIVNIEEQ